MSAHVTSDLLRRLGTTDLPLAAMGDALRHARECEPCADELRRHLDGTAAAVRESLERALAETEHLDDTSLIAWVDGSLDDADRERWETHIEDCPNCRGEVDDLQRTIARRRSSGAPIAWLAVAAAAVIVMAGLFVARRPAPRTSPVAAAPPSISVKPRAPVPSPPPVTPRAPEWQRLIDSVLERGRLPVPPVVESLETGSETMRGAMTGTHADVTPAGIVVESARPSFRWPAAANATSVVSVFDGQKQVARSPALSKAAWTPDRELPRGRVLVWQVEVVTPEGTTILPAPPNPPAIFAVASADAHEELVRARSTRPDDHLLLAVLYARAGMLREADAELTRAEQTDPRIARLRRR